MSTKSPPVPADQSSVERELTILRGQKAKLEELLQLRKEVRELQASLWTGTEARETVSAVARRAAAAFHVDMEYLLGPRRTEEVVVPRHVIFYLARKIRHEVTSTLLAEMFHRDHGTVLHGCKMVVNRMDASPTFRARVEQIEQLARQDISANHQQTTPSK